VAHWLAVVVVIMKQAASNASPAAQVLAVVAEALTKKGKVVAELVLHVASLVAFALHLNPEACAMHSSEVTHWIVPARGKHAWLLAIKLAAALHSPVPCADWT